MKKDNQLLLGGPLWIGTIVLFGLMLSVFSGCGKPDYKIGLVSGVKAEPIKLTKEEIRTRDLFIDKLFGVEIKDWTHMGYGCYTYGYGTTYICEDGLYIYNNRLYDDPRQITLTKRQIKAVNRMLERILKYHSKRDTESRLINKAETQHDILNAAKNEY